MEWRGWDVTCFLFANKLLTGGGAVHTCARTDEASADGIASKTAVVVARIQFSGSPLTSEAFISAAKVPPATAAAAERLRVFIYGSFR